MVKRISTVPKFCSRCGNDLMTGKSIYHFPFEKRYIVLCAVCHTGLNFPIQNFASNQTTNEEWKKFWEEEVHE